MKQLKTLGEDLRHRRKRLGLTQPKLLELAGNPCCRRTLIRFENNQHQINKKLHQYLKEVLYQAETTLVEGISKIIYFPFIVSLINSEKNKPIFVAVTGDDIASSFPIAGGIELAKRRKKINITQEELLVFATNPCDEKTLTFYEHESIIVPYHIRTILQITLYNMEAMILNSTIAVMKIGFYILNWNNWQNLIGKI